MYEAFEKETDAANSFAKGIKGQRREKEKLADGQVNDEAQKTAQKNATVIPLTLKKEEEKINEQVKELYKKNINNIEKMLRGLEINEEIQKIKEEFIEKFQDAYSALKDRNSREHYIDLFKEIKDDKAENGNNHECKGGEEEWAK